jgi:repressor LexA
MEFCEKLRVLRKRLGVSPEKLADLCTSSDDNATISGQYIRRLESGFIKSPTLETARVLARGLGVTVSELIDSEGIPEPVKRPVGELLKELSERMELVSLPLRGAVPAGYPFAVDQEQGESVEISREMLGSTRPDNAYALKISGDSLVGDKIHSGDTAVVDSKAMDVIDGKIYIVRIGNEVCARHVHKQNDRFRLTSSNGDYKDILASEVEILGRVIAAGHWNSF